MTAQECRGWTKSLTRLLLGVLIFLVFLHEFSEITHEMTPAPGHSQVSTTLVYDVGMNNGDDTSLLLELGYTVVSVEANPVLVRTARKRFASEIRQGRLTIAHVALLG